MSTEEDLLERLIDRIAEAVVPLHYSRETLCRGRDHGTVCLR
jgi:hypothetical protein